MDESTVGNGPWERCEQRGRHETASTLQKYTGVVGANRTTMQGGIILSRGSVERSLMKWLGINFSAPTEYVKE